MGNLCHIISHLIIYVEIIKSFERCFVPTMNVQDKIIVKVLIPSCLIVGLPDGTFSQTTSCLYCLHALMNRPTFRHCFLPIVFTQNTEQMSNCDCHFAEIIKSADHKKVIMRVKIK